MECMLGVCMEKEMTANLVCLLDIRLIRASLKTHDVILCLLALQGELERWLFGAVLSLPEIQNRKQSMEYEQ